MTKTRSYTISDYNYKIRETIKQLQKTKKWENTPASKIIRTLLAEEKAKQK